VADFDWPEGTISPHDEPFAGLRALGTFRAFVDVAERAGARTILSGSGSDEILDGAPFRLADLVSRLHWVRAWKEGCAWAKAWNQNARTVLKRFAVGPLAPRLSREGLRGWLLGSSWPRLGCFSGPPWVRPDVAPRHSLARRARDQARRHLSRRFRQAIGWRA
jgi:asparagine synthase (glutamine-hydrolysing)